MKTLCILGSTGSIGTQCLDIVSAFPEHFKISGLAAGNNITLLKKQITQFKPHFIAIKNETDCSVIQNHLNDINHKATLFFGDEGLCEIATIPCDMLVAAIVGTASLLPTYLAIEKGTAIALACKEILVSGGTIITDLAKKHNVSILPVDSEHAAIKQCLEGTEKNPEWINKIILTASGGPFWNTPKEQFESITLEQALKHPTWTMGSKITIDSSTLMNKGLEVIEAHHLFNIPFSKIEVIIHPQSIIHSLVEFTDGNILAHLGLPDMRFPIQYALTYPEKWKTPWPKTQLSQLKDLQFHDPDFSKFPLLKLAFECGELGNIYPAILNAANEAAVSLFLNKKISYMDIGRIVRTNVEKTKAMKNPSISDIIALDKSIKEQIIHDHIN